MQITPKLIKLDFPTSPSQSSHSSSAKEFQIAQPNKEDLSTILPSPITIQPIMIVPQLLGIQPPPQMQRGQHLKMNPKLHLKVPLYEYMSQCIQEVEDIKSNKELKK